MGSLLGFEKRGGLSSAFLKVSKAYKGSFKNAGKRFSCSFLKLK